MAGNRQGERRSRRRERKPRKPLSRTSLEELALAYVARFATTAAKLERYLSRKVWERGWEDEGQDEPDIRALVDRFVERNYVDDAAYAKMRSSDLLRRGYGARRVNQALRQAGVAGEVREDLAPGEAAKRRAALRLAEKRGFGPFGLQPPDREKREKQIAAMLRAGHSFDHTRALIDAESADMAREWVAEAEEEEDDEDDLG